MKNSLISLCVIWLSGSVTTSLADDDPIQKIGWKKIEGIAALDPVKSETGSPKPISLLQIKDPPIKERNHAVGGEIRYSGVSGTGFVEMWTVYEGGGRYFSRTLGNFGPMAKLAGSSEWRPFLLPFFGDGKQLPIQLEINLILPGGGEVEFRNVGLYQLPGDRLHTGADRSGWWSDTFAAKLGAVGGSACGVWGAFCGILCGLGKGRLFVTSTMIIAAVAGVISGVFGVVALVINQPYAVWYPLVIFAVIFLPVGIGGYITARKIYLARELRAISAAG
ncbi:MAG: hypothetical protein P1V20_10530 [Verrucomicrobiales bacterium]|nr:hypothetical protein [Verrucomicrobiales bacterium]